MTSASGDSMHYCGVATSSSKSALVALLVGLSCGLRRCSLSCACNQMQQ